MKYPFREYLEVCADEKGAWIRCTRCSHVLCSLGENWKAVCKRRLLPPTKAGPLMKELIGHYLLEQLYCPGCAALLNTDVVEEKPNGQKGRAEQARV